MDLHLVEAEVLTFRPGDRVLLVVKQAISMQAADRMYEALRKRLPGVEFAIVSGVDQIAVERGQ